MSTIAAGFEEVVDGLGDPLAVGPVERLPEGDQPERSELQGGMSSASA
jgi:hypothetical protein